MIEHLEYDGRDPSPENRAIVKWFLSQVEKKNIFIDYEFLQKSAEERIVSAVTMESRAILHLGFNALDHKKFREVVESFKNPITLAFLRDNFQKLLNLTEITLTYPDSSNTARFSLVKRRKGGGF